MRQVRCIYPQTDCTVFLGIRKSLYHFQYIGCALMPCCKSEPLRGNRFEDSLSLFSGFRRHVYIYQREFSPRALNGSQSRHGQNPHPNNVSPRPGGISGETGIRREEGRAPSETCKPSRIPLFSSSRRRTREC